MKVSSASIVSRAKDQFAIELDPWQVIENSARALDLMHMLKLETAVLEAEIDENFCVKMPNEAIDIKWVIDLNLTLPTNIRAEFHDRVYQQPQIFWRSFDSNTPFDYEDSQATTLPKGMSERQKAIIYDQQKGPYLPYKWECPNLLFNVSGLPIAVKYNYVPRDKEGFPIIPEEAFEGCLYYCLYVYMQPLFLLGKIQGPIFQQVQMWKDQKINQSKQKKGMADLSQNEMDKVLNALSTFDRKRVNLDS